MATKYAGVDLSCWNTNVDYVALKAGKILGYPVKFAMIRLGYAQKLDSLALKHIDGCIKAGLYVGLYHYSYATTAAGAKEEAEWVIKTIKEKGLDGKISYPVAYYIEEQSQFAKGKTVCTAMCKAFMSTIAAANYQPMLYTGAAAYNAYISKQELKDYPLWIAGYIKEESLKGNYGITDHVMWQHSVAGSVPNDTYAVKAVAGVPGECDCNWAYAGLARQIREAGKNKLLPAEYTVTGTKTVPASKRAEAEGQLKALGYTVTTVEA